jgi:drug/metabolite transporter (DMT)-like permease
VKQDRNPIVTGVLLALVAAGCFGVTTPFVQRFGHGVGPFATAAALYLGAALMSAPWMRSPTSGVLWRRQHLTVLAGMAVFGAFLAPVLLAWGLARTSGSSASLMLNLEAVFTVALGAIVNHEHIGRRVWIAVALIAGGGTLLVIDHGYVTGPQALGLIAVAGATLAWGVDNTLSRHLSELHPPVVVLAKGTLGASISIVLAVLNGETLPPIAALGGLLACGAIGYGLSLRLYLLAQRRLGSARTGSVFATAPFIGGGVAWALGEPFGGALAIGAIVLMAIGVYLHLTESHEHDHAHEAMEHDHEHTHADGHHDHVHDPLPSGPHSHSHRHDATAHRHPHAEDLHHRHPH